MGLNKIKINDVTTINTGVVYDISKATGQTYETFADALGTDGNNVPPEVREGGMSVRFVHTGDNKYEEYRLIANDFTSDVSCWHNIDVTKEIGAYSASLVENASSMIYTEVIKNLGIKQGENFSIKVSGTHSGDRILLRANNTSGYNIQDFCEIDKLYYKTAESDIDSIFVYHNGNIDITLYVNTNLEYQIKKNADNIDALAKGAEFIAPLNKEVFARETTVVDSTAPNPTYLEQDFEVKAGNECTVILEAIKNFSAIISAADAQNNVIESLLDGAMTRGQVITKTFTPSVNVYRIRISFSARGILKLTTVNQSLRQTEDTKIEDLDDRTDDIEGVLNGVEDGEVVVNSVWDMSGGNLELSSIEGPRYTLVKYKIVNPTDTFVSGQIFWRDTHLASHPIQVFKVLDRNSVEGVIEMPEEFVSVGYQRTVSWKPEISVTTILNPYIKDNISEEAVSSNVLDVSTLTNNKALKPDNTEAADNTYSYTDFIPVKEGQKLVLTNDVVTHQYLSQHDVRPQMLRYVTAFGYNKENISALGQDAAYNYVVPKGVHYVKVTAKTTILTGAGSRINTDGLLLPYEPYWKGTRPTGVTENEQAIQLINRFPLSTLPEYVVNAMAQRPLGSLSKGYLCVTDDDGSIGLGTYTLPMVIQKEVPITFFVMKESEIFQQGNEQYKTLFLDAVNNHGCAVSQHGGMNWTEFNENQLYEFFKVQKSYWDSLGITVKGSGCPSGFTTRLIEVVAGGMFETHRSCYGGLNPDNTPNYHAIHTEYYACIPRTSMYCIPSVNVRSYTLEQWQNIIDYVLNNKLLLVVYFHDYDFVETAEDYQARRVLLEGFLDYAKEHITMVTMADIPRLV